MEPLRFRWILLPSFDGVEGLGLHSATNAYPGADQSFGKSHVLTFVFLSA